jgi:hypothetical protein
MYLKFCYKVYKHLKCQILLLTSALSQLWNKYLCQWLYSFFQTLLLVILILIQHSRIVLTNIIGMYFPHFGFYSLFVSIQDKFCRLRIVIAFLFNLIILFLLITIFSLFTFNGILYKISLDSIIWHILLFLSQLFTFSSSVISFRLTVYNFMVTFYETCWLNFCYVISCS